MLYLRWGLEFNEKHAQHRGSKILLKNLNQKKWIVIEKDKNNYILNFNTQELYEYLKGKGKECFKDLSINDSDTDYFFPTDEIYENLKKFYSQCI